MAPVQNQSGFGLTWIIQRNPAYLLSAILMAIGARLLLVSPLDPTGDIQLILVTLAVLQIYEWTVSAILIALHRSQRSPEDKPSLLLVAALFWTGPLAATMEMIALRPALGTIVAAGACLIALVEMRICIRALGLRLTTASQLVAAACVILIAGAAPLLKMPDTDSGANEINLYATWWVFGSAVLGCTAAVRSQRRRAQLQGSVKANSSDALELAFLALTISAAAVHLIGMNYAFFCHAARFYASPALIALAVVGFEWNAAATKFSRRGLVFAFLLPGVAMWLALLPFDAHVPIDQLPVVLREPILAVSTLAALAWWFGFARLRHIVYLHAGNAAFVVSALQFSHTGGVISPLATPTELACALYGVVAYLAVTAWLYRSRAGAVLALFVNMAATYWLLLPITPSDILILYLLGGWSALAVVHLAQPRPRLSLRVAVIAYLIIIPWTVDDTWAFQLEIATHVVMLVVVLFVIGRIWPWTRYRTVAVVLASVHLVALGAYGTSQSAYPAATTLVCTGFALLAGGALISWQKARLLELVAFEIPEVLVSAPDGEEIPSNEPDDSGFNHTIGLD